MYETLILIWQYWVITALVLASLLCGLLFLDPKNKPMSIVKLWALLFVVFSLLPLTLAAEFVYKQSVSKAKYKNTCRAIVRWLDVASITISKE